MKKSELRKIIREEMIKELGSSNDWGTMSTMDKLDFIRKAKKGKKKNSGGFACMECGAKIRGTPTSNTKCKKCGSYDIDLAEGNK